MQPGRDANAPLFQKLRAKVTEHYKAELWEALKAGLSVICSLSLAERTNPVALIYEGPSGRGKSTIINMCEPDRNETKELLYRLDSFTPRSFVSHAANVKQEELATIDLLPKLKDKVLLVKELAPLFRGRDDALRDNFSMLTAVLDGKGHKSASGVHGTRGYEGRYIFNWLGATTPIPARTDAIMAQLGNRLLRYEIIGEEPREGDLIKFAQSYQPATVEDDCRALVNELVLRHFKQFPVGKVDPTSVTIGMEQAAELVNFAQLTAQGRVEVETCTVGEEDHYIAGQSEGPHRVIVLLRTIALGLALLESKDEVDGEITDTIRHISFSSIPRNRRQLLRAVLANGGEISTSKAAEVLKISAPTAREFMKELAATGLVQLKEGRSQTPSTVTLADNWSWLLGDERVSTETPAESKSLLCA